MKTGFANYFRLIGISLFKSRNTPARWTPKRAVFMGLITPFLLSVQAVHWLAFALDHVLFPDFKKVKAAAPVFIVGPPRTGTTFLQRVLSNDTDRFTTFTLWELLFAPAICERKFFYGLGRVDAALGRPLERTLGLVERSLFKEIEDMHASSLKEPEEDYFVLLPICACFLLVLAFPHPDEIWTLARFDEKMPPRDKDRVMKFYKGMVKRHLYVHGPHKQHLSKNPSFTPMVESLLQTFPDAKIIATMRNPLKSMPSLLSTMVEGARIFDNDLFHPAFQEGLIDMLHYFYRHLLEILPEKPENQQVFVTMEAMKRDLLGEISRIYERFGFHMSPEFFQYLKQESAREKSYKSSHSYSLEQFNLDPDQLRRDLDYVFERFGYSEPGK